jgi:hypothetical protein
VTTLPDGMAGPEVLALMRDSNNARELFNGIQCGSFCRITHQKCEVANGILKECRLSIPISPALSIELTTAIFGAENPSLALIQV